MRYNQDKRTVMTLDAGGTNLVFSAMQAEEEIITPLTLSAEADDLNTLLKRIIDGFEQIKSQVREAPVAISFSFPGPAEYEMGIIGDLANLPAFRGGVALGPMLEYQFGIPVFINNDGDLFAYGEAIAGFLPEINKQLQDAESPKYYQNLFGATFGTGFGGGIVNRNQIFLGDNSASGEINRLRNKLYPDWSVEESLSIRGIKRVYTREAGIGAADCPEPKEIFDIGSGKKTGIQAAAVKAFEELGIVAGDAFANTISLVDGLIVIGGGLAGAHPLFLNKLVQEMNRHFNTVQGDTLTRMEVTAFNLEDPKQLQKFIEGEAREITIPFSQQTLQYDPLKRIGVGISRLGTNKATSIGAYTFALQQLDTRLR